MDYCLEVMMQYDVCPTSSGLDLWRKHAQHTKHLAIEAVAILLIPPW